MRWAWVGAVSRFARAALSRGAHPIVVDESRDLSKPELAEQARAEGIDLRLGWSGSFAELDADLVVVNPAVDSRHPKLRDVGVELVSEVEFASRIARGPIVAVTGTNGKSTTTVMAYLALRACGLDPILCGNLYGSGYPEAPLTEAVLNGREGQPLVAEISSFGLEWTSTFRAPCRRDHDDPTRPSRSVRLLRGVRGDEATGLR